MSLKQSEVKKTVWRSI